MNQDDDEQTRRNASGRRLADALGPPRGPRLLQARGEQLIKMAIAMQRRTLPRPHDPTPYPPRPALMSEKKRKGVMPQ